MNSALANVRCVVKSALGTGSVQYGSSSWCPLTEATPAALSTPKPCHVNQVHDVNKKLLQKNLG